MCNTLGLQAKLHAALQGMALSAQLLQLEPHGRCLELLYSFAEKLHSTVLNSIVSYFINLLVWFIAIPVTLLPCCVKAAAVIVHT